MTTSKRLEILKESLEKKMAKFDNAVSDHFATVRLANGQPLNDKRNGRATFKKWEKQNDTLRNLEADIEKTKDAIFWEEEAIRCVESTKEILPSAILEAMEAGKITQWRKHPTIFFIAGVDKARIQFYPEKKMLVQRFARLIPKEQYPTFRDTVNELRHELLARKEIIR